MGGLRLAGAMLLVCGCVRSNAVSCDDRECPVGTVCDDVNQICATVDQRAACDGKAENDACMYTQITGTCINGSCISASCGDGVVQPGEVCDDGNKVSGDGCSSDCASNETCGNLKIDVVAHEECDDGNHLDHDGCSSTCKIEQPHWLLHQLRIPSRYNAAIAYDSKKRRALMFGGTVGNGALADTYEWTGVDWAKLAPAHTPPSLAGARMVYDEAREQIVMFGGKLQNTIYTNGTWLWDGADWHAATTVGPPPRDGFALAYDKKRQKVVLFGGEFTSSESTSNLDETWEWDGTSWTQVTPATKPPPRYDGVMAYDDALQAIVLVGGRTAFSTMKADTWTYDGAWHDVTNGTQPIVADAGLAWDAGAQELVLAGGVSTVTDQAVTWTWNGSAWTNRGNLGYSARQQLMLAETKDGLLLYGGTASGTPQNDTYTYALHVVRAVTNPVPRARATTTIDPVRGQLVIQGGTKGFGQFDTDTWVQTRTGGFTQLTSGNPTGRMYNAASYDPISRQIVMFGGFADTSGTTSNAETWLWNGTAWTAGPSAGAPSSRGGHAMAFDGTATIVTGGETDIGLYANGAAAWNGSAWSTVAASTQFSESSAAYDRSSKQLVIFGGEIGEGTPSAITYTFDHAAWSMPATAITPSARYGASFAWNPARQRLTMFGGGVGSYQFDDAFEWHGEATPPSWDPIALAAHPTARVDHQSYTSLDGTGITIAGGTSNTAYQDDRWELRWDGPGIDEQCDDRDLDGDGLKGCDDPDCWSICTPLCPPGTVTCDPSLPKCGDGVCDSGRESCETCPSDCGGC
ncbi:MAG: DUF4215 domain-containing protein [Kofleriaceae bacterium]